MLIEILDMDLRKGLFLVGAVHTKEQVKVTGYQLAHSLTCTNQCTNAKLHSTGLMIQMKDGEIVKYNVKPIDAKLKMAIRKYMQANPEKPVEKPKQVEEKVVKVEEVHTTNTRQAETTPVKPVERKTKPVAQVGSNGKTTIVNGVIKGKISDGTPKEEKIKIYHMGNFYNQKEICKKYGCEDVENFTRLYKLGYPLMMCLGKEKFNPDLKPVPREKQHDAYLRTLGQY